MKKNVIQSKICQFKAKIGNSQIDLEVKGSGGHASRCEIIIKGGLNLNFHVVIKVAIQPQYLAALTAVLSTVGGVIPR